MQESFVGASGASLSRRHGEKFSPGTPTPSPASATLRNDPSATPRNEVRQNAGQILALAGFRRVLNAMKYQ